MKAEKKRCLLPNTKIVIDIRVTAFLLFILLLHSFGEVVHLLL